jgi:hypothetical protein
VPRVAWRVKWVDVNRNPFRNALHHLLSVFPVEQDHQLTPTPAILWRADAWLFDRRDGASISPRHSTRMDDDWLGFAVDLETLSLAKCSEGASGVVVELRGQENPVWACTRPAAPRQFVAHQLVASARKTPGGRYL